MANAPRRPITQQTKPVIDIVTSEQQRIKPATQPKQARAMPTEKTELHPRNLHRGRYDFDQLTQSNHNLKPFVQINAYGDHSINFANPQAVKALNQALLKSYYAIEYWDIPAQYLCPPIPSRADYIHTVADLLGSTNLLRSTSLLANSSHAKIPMGMKVQVLDIGVGANVIYPLIGQRVYGWQFVGVDINAAAINNAQRILDANSGLSEAITLRLQPTPSAIFNGIILPDDRFDLTMCNPPFHTSMADAQAGTQRKWQKLANNKVKNATKNAAPLDTKPLNFGGQGAELHCEGGEAAFVNRMILESAQLSKQCFWFSTLISKATNLPKVYRALKQVKALEVNTFAMFQGQKQSRVVAWTFLNPAQQLAWKQQYWEKK
jgi:23S rRNA (adenine1618-N6)-methyltransferase